MKYNPVSFPSLTTQFAFPTQYRGVINQSQAEL